MFLLVVRTMLGIGMGAEWPAGAALAMETWPIRSRGLMSSVLQGSWALGYLLSAAALCDGVPVYRLARHAVDRRAAGARGGLDPHLREGTGGLGGKPAEAESQQTPT